MKGLEGLDGVAAAGVEPAPWGFFPEARVEEAAAAAPAGA